VSSSSEVLAPFLACTSPADVLVIEEQPLAGPPRVETFSFKSRDLRALEGEALRIQLEADAADALRYYGGTLDIRRSSLGLRGEPMQVQRVRLMYEGALKPQDVARVRNVVHQVEGRVRGVEVLFQ
jgi:hypothetical protein